MWLPGEGGGADGVWGWGKGWTETLGLAGANLKTETTRQYSTAQGTVFSILRKIIMGGKRIYVCVYG